jgi:hypothetical protein
MTILEKLTLSDKTKTSMLSSMLMGMGYPSARDGTGQIQFATAKAEGAGGLQTTPNLLKNNPYVSR